MALDTVLLIIIAAFAALTTLGVIVAVIVLLRTISGLEQTRARADRILSEVEKEAGPTIKEVQGTARGLTELLWILKRLGEEAMLGLVGRRTRREAATAAPGSPSQPSKLSALHAGLDVGFRLVELWRIFKGPRARAGE